MRALFRLAYRLLILFVLLLAAVVLLRDPIVRELAQYRLSHRTGLEVKIGSVDIGLFDPRVTIENLVIYNSADFGGSPLVEMPELHLEYDRDALFSRRLHFRLIRLNFTSGSVVEDKHGRLNLEVLKQHLEKTGGSGGGTNRTASSHYKFLGVDTLNLTLGHVDFLRMKNPSHVDTLKLDIRHQVMTNLQTAGDFGSAYLGTYEWILFHNNLNLGDTNNPDNPWPIWRARLEALSKKQP